jgi:hypothetical protein
MSPFFFIGGVAGGLVAIVALALIAFFYRRRRRRTLLFRKSAPSMCSTTTKMTTYHLIDLPHYYIPEPFLVPDPTIGGTSEVASTRDRPLSMTTADTPRPQTPVGMTAATNTTRKSGPLAQLRPLNIIQHDDAGPMNGQRAGEPETIELPPAYTNIRSAQRPPGTASTASTETTIS